MKSCKNLEKKMVVTFSNINDKELCIMISEVRKVKRVTHEDVLKVRALNLLEVTMDRCNVRNKDTATIVIEVVGFNGEYLNVDVRVCEGFTTHKKILTSTCLEGLEQGKIYIVNPSFVNRYMKQKWYVNYYDCLCIDGDNKYFIDAMGNKYTV